MNIPSLGVHPSKNDSILSRNTFGRDMTQAKGGNSPVLSISPITAAALLPPKATITDTLSA